MGDLIALNGLIALNWFEASTWEWVIDPGAWLIIFQVALGLGLIIFVHELGHFVVAKLCGVKCEKFYLGFDIGGYKLLKFRRGETEYGIGILPLGGYVKMLGQEDNPARLREELERAKAAKAAGEAPSAQETADGQEPLDIEAAEAALYDPRSFLAQSVPKRMAIISAGVIMNLLFAFLAAAGAYALGVREVVCAVGAMQPASPAWTSGIKVGDRIVAINEEPVTKFDDLRLAVSLSKGGKPVDVHVVRKGTDKEQVFTMHPDRSGLLAMIGVRDYPTLTLSTNEKLGPCLAGSPAASASPVFQSGDRIVQIGDVPVNDYIDLLREFARNPDKVLPITVERDHEETYEENGEKKTRTVTERLASRVSTRAVNTLGLTMEMGPISSIQEGSPAALAGVKEGDRLKTVAGQAPGDPLALAETLRKMAGKDVEFVFTRDGEDKKLTLHVAPPDDYCTVLHPTGDMGVPTLGIAYPVSNKVAAVTPGGPADKAGLKAGDVVAEITLTPPSDEALQQRGLNPKHFSEQSYDLTKTGPKKKWAAWPFVFEELQMLPLDSKVTLTLVGKDQSVELTPTAAAEWFHPDRGFRHEPDFFFKQAEGLRDALSLGAEETWSAATKVLILLERLRTGEISPRVLGGPVMIATAAGSAASAGPSPFLLFLTLLSANLAVINFLPIPVLDGGHMVFLLWEGVRRKPVDERVQLALSYAGLLLILCLMLWVFALDFNWIPRE